jgi:hypothetical protein
MSADGSLVVSELPGEVVRLFDVGQGVASRVRLRLPGGPAGVSVAPGGEYVARMSAGWPDTATLAVGVVDSARAERLPYTLELEPIMAFDARFSGDGRTLVTADDDVVVARDAATGRRVAGSDPYRAQEAVAYLGVDQDGRRVALSWTGGDVEVADLTTGEQLAHMDPTPGSGTAARSLPHLTFSPDGRWLAMGSDSGEVMVRDTRTWEEVATWRVVGGGVQSLAFTADSQTLLAGGGGRAWLRSVADPGAAAATVELDPLRTGGSVSVGSREDGRVLVTHTDHSGLQLWRVAPGALLAHACRVAGRDLTEDEWAAALPERPHERTCP